MQKKFGFTLLELLIAVAIMGILAATTVPTFRRISQVNAFETDIRAYYETLTTARANALAEKGCPGVSPGDPVVPAAYWVARITATTMTPRTLQSYQLWCFRENMTRVSVSQNQLPDEQYQTLAHVPDGVPLLTTFEYIDILIGPGGRASYIATPDPGYQQLSSIGFRVQLDTDQFFTICYDAREGLPILKQNDVCP